jgi:hypothetical protein
MDDGIIISWAGWHVHCDEWAGTYTEEEFVKEAFRIIDGLISERLAVILRLSGNRITSGQTRSVEDLDEQFEPEFWLNERNKREIIAVSWKGTYDRGDFDPKKLTF